jgi:hypothetical protein
MRRVFSLNVDPLPLFWRYHTAGSTMEKPSKRRVPEKRRQEKLITTSEVGANILRYFHLLSSKKKES